MIFLLCYDAASSHLSILPESQLPANCLAIIPQTTGMPYCRVKNPKILVVSSVPHTVFTRGTPMRLLGNGRITDVRSDPA
jgi:hypothetical protein